MSIYRDPRSPYWQYSFDIDGHRFSGSTRKRHEDEAAGFEEARKADANRQLEQLEAEKAAPLTFKRAAARWWTEHGSTLADAKNKAAFDRLVEIIGPKAMLAEIDDNAVSQMIVERRKDVRRDSTDQGGKVLYRPVTATTVNRTTSLLRRILNRARDNWNIALPKIPKKWKKHWLKETKRHIRELSPAEESTLDDAESLDYADIRRFAIITGLRRRDVLLRWPQVDFELAVIRVITKGGVPRVIPLSREAYEILWRKRGQHAEWAFTYQAQRTWKSRPNGGPVLIKGQRYPITYSGLGSNKRKWEKAGVKARIHDLRHTTGMRTLRKTGNLKIVQVLLGHTDIAVTAKFYTDATVEDLRAAMEATAPREIASDHRINPRTDRQLAAKRRTPKGKSERV